MTAASGALFPGRPTPYLKWRYTDTPQVVSGTAIASTAGDTVQLVRNGASLAGTGTGANGFYYFLMDNGTLTTGDAALAYVDGGSITGSAVYCIDTAVASITGLNITSGTVSVYAGSSTATLDVTNMLSTAVGTLVDSDILYSVTGDAAAVSGDLKRRHHWRHYPERSADRNRRNRAEPPAAVMTLP